MKFFNKLWNKSKLIRIIIHIISFLLGFKFYFLLKKVPDFVTTDHLIDPVEDLDGTKYYPVFKFIDDGSRCTGFVISPNHALTAAHCLSDISKKKRL